MALQLKPVVSDVSYSKILRAETSLVAFVERTQYRETPGHGVLCHP